MKSKFFGFFVFAAIAVAAGFNYQQNKQEAEFSDLAIANIEALASGENGEAEVCYHTITSQPGSKVLFCGSCTYIDNSTYTWTSGEGTCG